jgi:hypothetical protein
MDYGRVAQLSTPLHVHFVKSKVHQALQSFQISAIDFRFNLFLYKAQI